MTQDADKTSRTVFVAGGGGFLGSRICDTFLQQGWQVISIGIGAPIGLRGEAIHHEGLVTRDLMEAAKRAQGAPDLIVHAADIILFAEGIRRDIGDLKARLSDCAQGRDATINI